MLFFVTGGLSASVEVYSLNCSNPARLLRLERRGFGKRMTRCASGALILLGRRPWYRGILLVILGRRLVCHRVDSGADNGNNHCFMALMSGAKVFVNDDRLLRSSP